MSEPDMKESVEQETTELVDAKVDDSIVQDEETGALTEKDASAGVENASIKGDPEEETTDYGDPTTTNGDGKVSSSPPSAAAASTAVDRTWDFTNRKVTVYNVMKFLDNRKVRKLTNEWLEVLQKDHPSMTFDKIKKPPKDNWVQVTLDSEASVQPFLDFINNSNLTNKKGGKLHATRVDVSGVKRGIEATVSTTTDADNDDEENGGEASSRKRPRNTETNNGAPPPPPKNPRDVITPLWKEPYDKQLLRKARDILHKSVCKIVKEVKGRFHQIERESKRNPNRKGVKVYDWLLQKRQIDVAAILPAPSLLRNKCEFTFGYRCQTEVPDTSEETNGHGAEEGKQELKQIPAVGFMASGWSGGVNRPHVCQNIPDEACAVVDILDSFLSDSPIPPYDSKIHRGLWRFLTVRTSRRTGECMVIVIHAPPGGGAGAKDDTDDYSALFPSERDRLIKMLTEKQLTVVVPRVFEADDTFKPKESEEDKPVHVTSVFFQEYEGLSNPTPEHPVQHAFGKTALHEKLGKCTFQISPGAFFQVNTPGAENLYNVVVDKIREVAKNPEETLLFDVCCGTGTIGLTCLKEGVVGRVVGVDISAPAIEDAKINAALNGFGDDSKVRFVASRAEHVLAQELKAAREGSCKHIIAVVDPARDGLHCEVIRALRLAEGIERIVYVSCNPTGSLIKDAGIFCAPPTKKYGGRAFQPTSAQPVDMFPLTDHCELVLNFDRISEEDSG